MEIANQWAGATLKTEIRLATSKDKSDIVQLLRTANYAHIHLDWRPPIDWLERDSFVILPQPSADNTLTAKRFGVQMELQACLAIGADPPPAAWVRVAAMQQGKNADGILAAMLIHGESLLRETAVTHIGWLATESWPNHWLPQIGFTRAHEIETYYKEDLQIPHHQTPTDLSIRPAQVADMPQLAEIEKAAFAPLWRHSHEGLKLAHQQVFSFDVAERNGRLVGFQLSSKSGENAHLARMTVLPEMQGQGVGSALLAYAIRNYQQHGIRYISLNTQTDNYPSQALYRKFGFYATGQRLPIWVKYLE